MRNFISLNYFLEINSLDFTYKAILLYAKEIQSIFYDKLQYCDLVNLENEMNIFFNGFKNELISSLNPVASKWIFQFMNIFASPWAWKTTFQNLLLKTLPRASIISTGTWWFMKNPEWYYSTYFWPFSEIIQYFRKEKIYTKWWFVQYCILIDVVAEIIVLNADIIIGDVRPWWVEQWKDREWVVNLLKQKWSLVSIKDVLILRASDNFNLSSNQIITEWIKLSKVLKDLKNTKSISTKSIQDAIVSTNIRELFMQDYENSRKAVLERSREWETEDIFNVRYSSNVIMNYGYLSESSNDLKIIYNNWSKDDLILNYN